MVTVPVAPVCSVTLSPPAVLQCSARSRRSGGKVRLTTLQSPELGARSLAQIPDTARTLLHLLAP